MLPADTCHHGLPPASLSPQPFRIRGIVLEESRGAATALDMRVTGLKRHSRPDPAVKSRGKKFLLTTNKRVSSRAL